MRDPRDVEIEALQSMFPTAYQFIKDSLILGVFLEAMDEIGETGYPLLERIDPALDAYDLKLTANDEKGNGLTFRCTFTATFQLAWWVESGLGERPANEAGIEAEWLEIRFSLQEISHDSSQVPAIVLKLEKEASGEFEWSREIASLIFSHEGPLTSEEEQLEGVWDELMKEIGTIMPSGQSTPDTERRRIWEILKLVRIARLYL
jgi:hypothetical protein